MKPKNFKIWRWLRWLVLLILVVSGSLCLTLWFTPIAKWLIVDKTLEVYQATDTIFAKGDDEPTAYQGMITDTIIKSSAKDKTINDTILHRQTINIRPERIPEEKKPRREDVGVFGDSAGLLNAIFSFLAFVAVLATIYLQLRKDWHDKRYGARMQFEQEFFAMVGMLEDIVSHLSIEITEPEGSAITKQEAAKLYGQQEADKDKEQSQTENKTRMVEGRDVFRYIYKDRSVTNLLNYVNKEESWYSSKEAQENCFDGTLDHYFRYLYRILKHINESELLDMLADTEDEREKYAHLLRAQLSNYELLMLFYNGLLEDHKKTIKKQIERYAMFNNLRVKELGDKHRRYYEPIARGDVYKNPEGYNEDEMYDVTAFWDKKSRERIRKELERNEEGKESRLCVKCYRRAKEFFAQKWQTLKTWCEEKPEESKEKFDVSEGKKKDCEVPETKTITDVAGKPKAEEKRQRNRSGGKERHNEDKHNTNLADQIKRNKSRYI